MLTPELAALTASAAALGFFHTLLGPDHYLPFIVMARAKKWTIARTALITSLCGIGHIGSSMLLGFIGIGIGLGAARIEAFDSFRSDIASWGLIAFGLVYFAYGVKTSWKKRPHEHSHVHADGSVHIHRHAHVEEHAHVHGKEADITPWVLFTLLVLGPCEPLIPLFMYPAVQESIAGLVWVTAAFGGVTIAAMTGAVTMAMLGFDLVSVKPLERFAHALAGITIFACGIAVQFFGI